ncbi:MAG: hypothetical protein ACMUIA_03185 [bacterium]
MWKKITVNCYSGYKINETPRDIVFKKKSIKIKQILDRWYEGGAEAKQPKLDYFKVLTETNQKYLLRYNTLFDAWSLWER